MQTMTPGAKRAIPDITSARRIAIRVAHASADIDIAAFGLTADRKIGDDRYVVLFSNRQSPEGAITLAVDDDVSTITVDLDRLPSTIDRVTIIATHDTRPLREASILSVEVAGTVTIDAKPGLGNEKAVMLLDLYRHGGDWRLGAVVQGFDGGLAALVEHFGGEVEAEETAPAPPVSLSKVDLRKQKVGVSLQKLGIGDIRAEVTFIIDASGSMAMLYQRGTMQETVERIAPVALRLDDDGTMDTWFYASRCKQVAALTADSLDGFIARTMPLPGTRIGAQDSGKKGLLGGAKMVGGESIGFGNDEPVVMRALLATEPVRRNVPRFVIFLTDGGIYPSTSKIIKEILRECSRQAIFWQFIGVGKANYGVLRELDTIDGRVVDNAGFFSVDDLSAIDDETLYDRLLSEFPEWLKAARSAGILT